MAPPDQVAYDVGHQATDDHECDGHDELRQPVHEALEGVGDRVVAKHVEGHLQDHQHHEVVDDLGYEPAAVSETGTLEWASDTGIGRCSRRTGWR